MILILNGGSLGQERVKTWPCNSSRLVKSPHKKTVKEGFEIKFHLWSSCSKKQDPGHVWGHLTMECFLIFLTLHAAFLNGGGVDRELNLWAYCT